MKLINGEISSLFCGEFTNDSQVNPPISIFNDPCQKI